jgi:hypothetical protein
MIQTTITPSSSIIYAMDSARRGYLISVCAVLQGKATDVEVPIVLLRRGFALIRSHVKMLHINIYRLLLIRSPRVI